MRGLAGLLLCAVAACAPAPAKLGASHVLPPLYSIAEVRRVVRDSNAVVRIGTTEVHPESLASLPQSEVVMLAWAESGACPGGRCKVAMVVRCERMARAARDSLAYWPPYCTDHVNRGRSSKPTP